MKESHKSLLIVAGTLLSVPLTILFIVLFHDFLYLIAFVSCVLACIGLTGYGLYEEIYEELTFRHHVHEQLYHGKSKDYAKRLDFFLDYFGDSEFK